MRVIRGVEIGFGAEAANSNARQSAHEVETKAGHACRLESRAAHPVHAITNLSDSSTKAAAPHRFAVGFEFELCIQAQPANINALSSLRCLRGRENQHKPSGAPVEVAAEKLNDLVNVF